MYMTLVIVKCKGHTCIWIWKMWFADLPIVYWNLKVQGCLYDMKDRSTEIIYIPFLCHLYNWTLLLVLLLIFIACHVIFHITPCICYFIDRHVKYICISMHKNQPNNIDISWKSIEKRICQQFPTYDIHLRRKNTLAPYIWRLQGK